MFRHVKPDLANWRPVCQTWPTYPPNLDGWPPGSRQPRSGLTDLTDHDPQLAELARPVGSNLEQVDDHAHSKKFIIIMLMKIKSYKMN